eukprot:TRINITY_DN3455_c0_g1_i4.p1 TRINITY_DN3455_c0_g1~~TRINITY_DN3455_c0_g1_i4.p1  ORF type:complete len:280 (-),score=34.62 TRINITY_DN3455_c0_g1_i4:777-1616(-)
MKRRNLHKIPGGEESVKREVEIMKRIHHRNCVVLVDFFASEEKEKLYIVSEYVGGGSVHDLCEKAPHKQLPIAQARYYFLQLLDALEYIHSLNVIHRDVKPDNMLLTVNGTLKLSDYGVAQELGRVEEHVMKAGRHARGPHHGQQDRPKGNGSPAFQPPEVASDRATPAADLWAAGISLYIMIVGKFPFEGVNVYTLFDNIANGVYTIPEWVDPCTTDFIQQMLKVDYKQRATIPQLREHEWVRCKLKNEPFIPIVPTPTAFRNMLDHPKSPTCSCTLL